MKAHMKRPGWLIVSVALLVSLLAAGCPAVIQQNKPGTDPQSQPVTSETDMASGATSSNDGVVIGTVTDPSGRPLAEATVSVPKGTAPVPEMTAITSSDGVYQWSLPAGTFTLEVHKDGYTTAATEVIVAAGETSTQDFVLQPQ